jgi:hypothetical protein
MQSCITMAAVASLLLAAGGPNPEPENAPPVPGWSFATQGSGIPRNQDAAGFATEVDREVAHGGHASVSIRSIIAETHFRAVTQLIKADAYRGKRVRLAGYLKTRDVRGGWAGLWLRVDGPDAKLLALDNMAAQRVMETTDWSRHAVVLDVPEAAVRLAFGALLHGTGQVWADDLTLEVVAPKEVTVTIKGVEPITHAERASNLDFEATGAGATDVIPGWSIPGFNSGSFSRRIVEGGAHGGRAFLEITSPPEAKGSEFIIVQGRPSQGPGHRGGDGPAARPREAGPRAEGVPPQHSRPAGEPRLRAVGRSGDGRPNRVPYQRDQMCRRTESNANPRNGMARHGTAWPRGM